MTVRIPVSLVTGFLGSGKTTLIGRLLRQPGFAGTLVIVNEFGEVGIDHALLEASSDDTILLANGCLCCTIRGNLVDTLLDVLQQREEGRIGAFDRVVVETSGVADPAPILGFVFGEPRIEEAYRLGAVITTCDAVTGAAALDRHPEAISQASLADQILITKADLARPDALAARLRRLNAGATIRASVQGDGLDPSLLGQPGSARAAHACAPDCADPHHHHHHDHTERFRPMVLQTARPLRSAEVEQLTTALEGRLGPEVLRLKGLLPLADRSGCAVIQTAGPLVHPPELLSGAAPAGRVVIIAEGEVPTALLEILAAWEIRPAMRLHPEEPPKRA